MHKELSKIVDTILLKDKKISKVSLINLLRFIFYKYKHIDNIIVFINVKNC